MYDIIIGFNKVILGINRRASKKVGVTLKEIEKIFANEFSHRKIFSLIKSTAQSLALSMVDYSGDIKYVKLTSVLEDQNRGNGVRRGSKHQFPESAKTLKGDDLGFGSLFFLGKEAPSPRFKSNPFMRYNVNTGKIIQTPETKKTLTDLNNLLQGRGNNSKLLEMTFVNEDKVE